jgi:hypothetical protein
MNGLMMHTLDGKYVDRESLELQWCPEKYELGNQHVPVSHSQAADIVQSEIERILGLKIRSEAFGLAQKGAQMFGVYTLETGNSEHGLSIGFRNSVNRTFALSALAGQKVFVCDNSAMVGETEKAVRRHTTEVEKEFRERLAEVLISAVPAYIQMARAQAGMSEVQISENRGAEIIGRGLYQDALKPQQATLACEAWRRNEHGHGRTLWGVYNAFTFGLHRGSPVNLVESAAEVHNFFLRELQAVGGHSVNLAASRIMPLLADDTAKVAKIFVDVPELEID